MQVEVKPYPNAYMDIYRAPPETSIQNWRMPSSLVVVFTVRALFTASKEGRTGRTMKEGTLRQDFCRSVLASRSCREDE